MLAGEKHSRENYNVSKGQDKAVVLGWAFLLFKPGASSHPMLHPCCYSNINQKQWNKINYNLN